MSNIAFHTGALFILGAGGSPLRIATMQETSFDFKGDAKKLMGENQFSVDSAVGAIDITAKAKTGQLDPEATNELFFGKTITSGAMVLEDGELGTVLAGKYTVTAGEDIEENLGVRDAITGRNLKQVKAVPAAGEYRVDLATGEYSFHVSQDDKKVIIDYMRADITGKKIVMTNELAGTTTSFRGIFAKKYRDGRKLTMICPKCTCDSTQFSFKQNDYTMPDFSFALSTDERGVAFEWHWSTAA
nr:MAG TPA: hypothetical protein [Caudoviricetes sp.]